jgi:hypothetical protein
MAACNYDVSLTKFYSMLCFPFVALPSDCEAISTLDYAMVNPCQIFTSTESTAGFRESTNNRGEADPGPNQTLD